MHRCDQIACAHGMPAFQFLVDSRNNMYTTFWFVLVRGASQVFLIFCFSFEQALSVYTCSMISTCVLWRWLAHSNSELCCRLNSRESLRQALEAHSHLSVPSIQFRKTYSGAPQDLSTAIVTKGEPVHLGNNTDSLENRASFSEGHGP